jgi:hypothetical protein
VLRGWGRLDGLELIGGKRVGENATARPSVVENLRRYRVRIDVQSQGPSASIDVQFDGQPHIRWEGETSLLANYFHWQLPDKTHLGLGVWGSEVTFHSLRIRRETD